MKKIIDHLKAIKVRLENEKPSVTFDWSNTVVSEITPNVERTLSKKFKACHENYNEPKIAGLYSFWISKLKPAFGLEKSPLYANEYLALKIGLSLISERLKLDISLNRQEFITICDTLRYHTSSPHMLYNLYNLWIEREKLRNCLKFHKINKNEWLTYDNS